MAIVVKAGPNDNTNDVIKEFKKAASASDIVNRTKNRRYYTKPSQVRAQKKTEMRRLKKRARSLKNQKNVTEGSLQRIHERLSSQS